MTIPTIDGVQNVLRDFELRMREILDGAWNEWLGLPDRARFSPRTRASIIFDFIKLRAVSEFDGDPNIRVLPKGQTVQFLFKNRVLVRFKKANSSGLGSNIETQAVLQFIDPQLELPDLLPEIYKVEVCYHLDELATKIAQMAVTAREMNRKLWSYELQAPPSAEITSLPPRGPDVQPPQVRVRKRKDDSDTSE